MAKQKFPTEKRSKQPKATRSGRENSLRGYRKKAAKLSSHANQIDPREEF